jgi:hypothetical protein
MALVSVGFGYDGVEQFQVLRLSRKEAGLFAGVTESGVRDAEKRGLHHIIDANGQSWLDPDDVAAWPWRAKLPSPAKRAAVLAAAAKARAHEARLAALQEQKRREAEDREAEEDYLRQAAARDAEDRLRADVRAKNEAAKAQFLRDHVDRRAALASLGLSPFEGWRLQTLCRSRRLREAEPPRETVIRGGFIEPLRAELGFSPLVHGGPFYIREDVLRIRAEATRMAEDGWDRGPDKVRAALAQASAGEILRALLVSGRRGR